MVIKSGIWTTCFLGAGMIFSIGCSQAMTDAFFATSVAESRDFHKVTVTAVQEHDTNMTEQHKAMSPEAAEAIDKLKAAFDAQIVELKKQDDDIHSKVGEVVGQLAARFANFSPGGSVASFVSDLVGTEADKTQTKTDEVRDAMLTGFKVVNGGLVQEGINRVAEIALMEKRTDEQTDATKNLLDAFKEETRSKFAGVDQRAFENLVAAKDDRAAFEQTLRDDLKLTPGEVADLKGLTTEQILAMIAAAVTAAGTGGFLAKTGKSRSHTDIEKLKAAISDITTASALHLPSPSAEATVTHRTKT